MIKLTGIENLEAELHRLNSVRFEAVIEKNTTQMFNRARSNADTTPGGTPVGDYKGGGQMRKSVSSSLDEVGYTAEYSAHVEYGHRTRNGGYVTGQRFLKKNVDIQRETYRKDLKKAITKG